MNTTTRNPFLSLLETRGFVQGPTGRFLSPDATRGEGVIVELSDTEPVAVAAWIGGRTLYNATNAKDAKQFAAEVF